MKFTAGFHELQKFSWNKWQLIQWGITDDSINELIVLEVNNVALEHTVSNGWKQIFFFSKKWKQRHRLGALLLASRLQVDWMPRSQWKGTTPTVPFLPGLAGRLADWQRGSSARQSSTGFLVLGSLEAEPEREANLMKTTAKREADEEADKTHQPKGVGPLYMKWNGALAANGFRGRIDGPCGLAAWRNGFVAGGHVFFFSLRLGNVKEKYNSWFLSFFFPNASRKEKTESKMAWVRFGFGPGSHLFSDNKWHGGGQGFFHLAPRPKDGNEQKGNKKYGGSFLGWNTHVHADRLLCTRVISAIVLFLRGEKTEKWLAIIWPSWQRGALFAHRWFDGLGTRFPIWSSTQGQDGTDCGNTSVIYRQLSYLTFVFWQSNHFSTNLATLGLADSHPSPWQRIE